MAEHRFVRRIGRRRVHPPIIYIYIYIYIHIVIIITCRGLSVQTDPRTSLNIRQARGRCVWLLMGAWDLLPRCVGPLCPANVYSRIQYLIDSAKSRQRTNFKFPISKLSSSLASRIQSRVELDDRLTLATRSGRKLTKD